MNSTANSNLFDAHNFDISIDVDYTQDAVQGSPF
jgi:hypothetical protein